jgi:hypothetical protein
MMANGRRSGVPQHDPGLACLRVFLVVSCLGMLSTLADPQVTGSAGGLPIEIAYASSWRSNAANEPLPFGPAALGIEMGGSAGPILPRSQAPSLSKSPSGI